MKKDENRQKRTIKRTARVLAVLTGACLVMLLGGCGKKEKEPVTVTLWHVYGGQTESPLNDLIDEFNGKDKNIRVEVGSVTNTNIIHEGVLAAANKEPGASELPDMFVSYPKTVTAMPDPDVLVNYKDYFTDEELSAFIPAFVEEGTIAGKLAILPVAKSTEILFYNKTAFDRFAEETGADLSEFETWDGLYRLAEVYEDWCGGTKPFFVHDYHFNYFQVGVESLGESFFDEKGVCFGPAFRRVWEPYARAALKGGVWLQGGYATEPLRTGDSIVSVASSASVLYYSTTVTYADNTTEEVEIKALPCPVFEDGKKLVMQRGAGICTVKSTPEREEACMVFLKWLTDPQKNVEFVTQLGYMPVKQESFDVYLPKALEGIQDPMYRSLYEAFLKTQEEYEFYTAPQRPDYLKLETDFEHDIREDLDMFRKRYLETIAEDPEPPVWKALDQFEMTFSQ